MSGFTEAGYAVRTWREKRELTVRQMASRLHVSAAYVSDIENGKRRLSIAMAERLARLSGVPSARWRLFQVEDDLARLNILKQGLFRALCGTPGGPET